MPFMEEPCYCTDLSEIVEDLDLLIRPATEIDVVKNFPDRYYQLYPLLSGVHWDIVERQHG